LTSFKNEQNPSRTTSTTDNDLYFSFKTRQMLGNHAISAHSYCNAIAAAIPTATLRDHYAA